MISNSMINFNAVPSFMGKCKKEQPEQPVKETTQAENSEPEEEYTFESTARAQRKSDMKHTRDTIGGALVALGIMTAPFVAANIVEDNDYMNGIVPTEHVLTEDDMKILEKADSLAKGGKDSTVLEAHEFRKLIDFTPLDGMSKSARTGVEISSTASFLPINMNDYKSKEEILNQVKNSQYIVNHVAEDYKKNPPKSYREMRADYVINNITPEEIMENVDFSELQHYQKDITITKGIISFSLENIKRDDIDAFKKKEKATERAQKFVDGIVNKYKIRAKVSGNYNGDEVLSKGELASLLDTQCLQGLPDEIAFRIIAKALEGYNPMDIRYVTDDKQVERTNEKVEENRQKAQEKLNEWAIKAQDYFFPILHPNEIRVKNRIQG